jgi:Tfp pilus assembly protein PilF
LSWPKPSTRVSLAPERLRQAKEAFEAGDLDRVHEILDEKALYAEQEKLLDESERINRQRKENADSFLVKARATTLEYDNPEWYTESCLYFEASIKSWQSLENMEAYAFFLQKNKYFNQSLTWYLKIIEQGGIGQIEKARTLNNLGTLQSDYKDYSGAANSFQEALKIYQQLAQSNPQAYLPDMAMTLDNLGSLQSDSNDFAGAEKSFKEALKIYRQLDQASPKAYLPDVAMTLRGLGRVQTASNDQAGAGKSFQEALEIQRQLTQSNPQAYLPHLASTLSILGHFQSVCKDNSGAEKFYQEALEIQRQLAQTNPQAYLPHVATTLQIQGIWQYARKDQAEAEKSFKEALEIYRQLAQANPRLICPMWR